MRRVRRLQFQVCNTRSADMLIHTVSDGNELTIKLVLMPREV
jgi:hypothetical protein